MDRLFLEQHDADSGDPAADGGRESRPRVRRQRSLAGTAPNGLSPAPQRVFHFHHARRDRTERLSAQTGGFRLHETLPGTDDPIQRARVATGGRPVGMVVGSGPAAGRRAGGLRGRPRNGIPGRGVPQMHLRQPGRPRNAGPDLGGPLPGNAALGRSGEDRHLRLELRRFHGSELHPERGGRIRPGGGGGAGHFMALLRHDLHRTL